jgi:hypothetical protein
MTQTVEHLPSKLKALSSKSGVPKRKNLNLSPEEKLSEIKSQESKSETTLLSGPSSVKHFRTKSMLFCMTVC